MDSNQRELIQHPPYQDGALPLSYAPNLNIHCPFMFAYWTQVAFHDLSVDIICEWANRMLYFRASFAAVLTFEPVFFNHLSFVNCFLFLCHDVS